MKKTFPRVLLQYLGYTIGSVEILILVGFDLFWCHGIQFLWENDFIVC